MRSIEPGETWVWCYADNLGAGEFLGDRFVPASRAG